MRRFLTLFIVLVFSGILAHAQNRTISGQVRDVQGAPVAFASVTEKGTSNATTSDASGNFSLRVKESAATLVVSVVGYDTQEIAATGSSVSVALVRNTQELAAVVVTGLAQVRQKSSLGYSTATIKPKELTQSTPVNLQNGLTAKVSGLNIATTNSGVLSSTRITLRGIRSLTGENQPMLVLDGVSISLSYISSINPNDVADVSILKSAAATAIYGPEGVNGAIFITTKRGSRQRPIVTVSQSTQVEKVAYLPQFQNRFGSGYNQDPNTGQGIFEPIEQQSWGPEFDGSIKQFGQDGPNGEKLLLPYSYVPNGRKNFFVTGITNQTDVSFSTGDFYLSGQNVGIQGTVAGDVNHRRTLTFRGEKEYNKFKAIFNAHYTNSKYNVTTANQLIYYNVTGAPGQYDLARFKNWRTDYFSSPNGYYTPYLVNFQRTPYFTKDINRQDGKSNDLFGNIELNYKATNWLNFVYRLGGSVTNSTSKSTREPFTPSDYHLTLRDASATAISATVRDDGNSSSRLLSEFFANFNTKIRKVAVSATLGQSYREIQSNTLFTSSTNLGQSDFLSIQTRIGEPNVGVGSTKSRLERYFGRLSFDFDGKFFLEGNASYDRDSRLVPNDKIFTESDFAFFYPGFNASLLLHKLIPGFESNRFINFLKLRGAISKTGNVSGLGVYATGTFGTGTFFPYGSTLGYTVPTTQYQRQYEPEFVKNNELGIELGFFKNRINIEGTIYKQTNSDQLLNLQLPNTAGPTAIFLNAAEFENKGAELDLKLTPLVKIGQLNIDFKVNYSYQTSKVTKLVDGVNSLGIGNFNYLEVGKSAYVFRLTDYVRDSATGKVRVGADGMPTLNPNLTTFGKTAPDNILGLSLNVSFKGLSLSVVGEYRGGNQIVADQLGQYLDDNGISKRSAQYGRRAFVWPNSVIQDGTGKWVENTNVYTSIYNRDFWNSELNTDAITNYLASGAFWKLREVSLSYEFPATIFKGSNFIKGLTIGVTGRNLLTWLPKSNQWTDPEFTSNGNNSYTGNAQGRSTAFNLPPTRIFGANIVAQF